MIKGFNHVGISVSNLEKAAEFYSKAFGMEFLRQSEFNPATADGRYEAILGLKGAAGRVGLMQLGDMRLELFEFAYPVPKRSDPNRPVCDHGITHFCVEVTDIEAEYERLKAAGATFHCPPLPFFGTATAFYARDPDGNVFEVIEMSVATN